MAHARSEMRGLTQFEALVLLAIYHKTTWRAPIVSTGFVKMAVNEDPQRALQSLHDSGYLARRIVQQDEWKLTPQGKAAAKELRKRRQ